MASSGKAAAGCTVFVLAFVLGCQGPAGGLATGQTAPAARPDQVGIVSNIQVFTAGQEDIASLEAWARTALKAGMSDADKALAIFETVVRYQHEMDPPLELVHHAKAVTDALKTFHVYGYNQCGPGASHVVELARFAGFKARGVTITGHTVAEIFYGGTWHMYDASYINYFPKPDGQVASVAEIIAAVKDWRKVNPGYEEEPKVRELHRSDSWTGWKTKGPSLLASCPLLDAKGYLPAKLMDWSHLMRMYNGANDFEYETGYSMGYQLNVQLRPGERLVRNWAHAGMHINMAIEGYRPWLDFKPGQGPLVYTPRYGDIAPGRVGNGTVEYDVPLGSQALRLSAWRYENLQPVAGADGKTLLGPADSSKPGVLEIRMPTSYIYLGGLMEFDAVVGEGGSVTMGISDNNGQDWLDTELTESAANKVNILPFVIRKYDYRLRFIIKGPSGLRLLRLSHDIQHSQRPLPALKQGQNTIVFAAGADEGTVTLEGATDSKVKQAQLVYGSFHPQVDGVTEDSGLTVSADGGQITFPVEVPAQMKRLRVFSHYRARDKDDGWTVDVSFDGAKTWVKAGRCDGPAVFDSRYFTVSDVPPGTKSALVRWTGAQRNALRLFNFRIDADYAQPNGGFRAVKVRYVWEEDGKEKTHEYVCRSPRETYIINCQGKPTMKSLTLSLAK